MTEDEYHIKENLLDSEWRSQNGVTIKSFVDLILDSYSSTKQERKEMNTLPKRPSWNGVVAWADEYGWFYDSHRERSPRNSPVSPPGMPPMSLAELGSLSMAPPSPAGPPPSSPKPKSKSSAVARTYSAVPPTAELAKEIWFDAHSREEKCLPPFSYLSHFLAMLLLGGGCNAFYSFLRGAGVTPAALEVFTSAVSETAVTIRPAASLTSRTFNAACSVISGTKDFVFSIGSSLSRMSGPLLNLFYTVYPLAVIRRGKGVKASIDSVIDDAESVLSRLSSLRQGVSDARDRNIVEARVKLAALQRHKKQLKDRLTDFISKLVGGTRTKYNKFQANICQALMEIYGGKRRAARVDSVERVNIMFEKAISFDVSQYAYSVVSSRASIRNNPNPALSRADIYGPALDETASFFKGFEDYHSDAEGPRKRTRKHRKGKGKSRGKGKGKRRTKARGHHKKLKKHSRKVNRKRLNKTRRGGGKKKWEEDNDRNIEKRKREREEIEAIDEAVRQRRAEKQKLAADLMNNPNFDNFLNMK